MSGGLWVPGPDGVARKMDNAPGLGFRIDKLWAFIAVVRDDEDEGVPAVTIGRTLIPMIAADETRLDEMRMYATDLSAKSRTKFRLVQFDNRTDLEEFGGDK